MLMKTQGLPKLQEQAASNSANAGVNPKGKIKDSNAGWFQDGCARSFAFRAGPISLPRNSRRVIAVNSRGSTGVFSTTLDAKLYLPRSQWRPGCTNSRQALPLSCCP